MSYRTSFQCPTSGQTIIAHYAFGRLLLRAAEDDGESVMPETLEYVKKHNKKRFHSLDAANEYLVSAADGQTFGFDS